TIVDSDTARLLGLNLYELLFFNAHANEWFERVWEGASELRLVLEFPAGALDLISFPWEFLYVPEVRWKAGGRYLVDQPNVSLVRRVLRKPSQGPPVMENAKFLFVDCLPPEPQANGYTPRSKAGRESATPPSREVDELMAFLEARGEVTLQRYPSFLDLRDQAAKGPSPDVIHLVGHGRFRAGAANKAFEFCLRPREAGMESWETDERIADALAGRQVPKLVLLHTCKGGKVGSYKDYEGAAIALVKRDVPNVIAVQHEIMVDQAAAFVRLFYDAWAREMSLELAIKEARGALRSASDFSFCLPVVYVQHDADLFLPTPVPAPTPAGAGVEEAQSRAPAASEKPLQTTPLAGSSVAQGAAGKADKSELRDRERHAPPSDSATGEHPRPPTEPSAERKPSDSPLSVRFGGTS
ncbi:MAG TPA: CHAT domain-containing protein, partial [Gemmatimonadaceae bacterium]|nr:CHAT domain-containing protein [Gemmatimonadaceae bacterium]